MNAPDNYRKRCYETFVSKHWEYHHNFSKETYDFLSKIAKKRYKDILPTDKNARIIDIACGSGHFLYFLQQEGYTNTTGIDLSEEQLGKAKEAGLLNTEKADLFDYLSTSAAKYDFIIANDIIEHLTKDETVSFLDLLYSSLVPGGKLLVSTLNTNSLFGSTILYCDFTHEQGFTPTSLSQILRVSNFSDIHVSGEKPNIHDFKSAIRAFLWKIINLLLRSYLYVERGSGRNMWKSEHILEPRIFAIATK